MKQFLLILYIAVTMVHGFGQATLSATVNKNKVAVTERFQLTITLSNGGNIKDYKAPSMSDFMILGGPNQSSSYSSFNGQVSQSVSYSYVLQAKSTGTFTIGAAYVKSGDKTLSSQPITVEVYEKQASTQNNQNNQKQDQNSGQTSIDDYLSQNVFIKTLPDKSIVYKGETVSVTYKLYIGKGIDIYDYAVSQRPKYDGFYEQSVNIADQRLTSETVNGKAYSVLMFKQSILTPQRTGTLELDPLTLDAIFGVQVQRKRSDSSDPFQNMIDRYFNDPFGSSLQQVKFSLASGREKITVRDLPANAPADFNGAVGNFTMKTELNATHTKTDEPLTYRIIIKGNGNLDLFNPPQLNLPPGWETYDPKTSVAGNAKTFEYLLIPRSPGAFSIPAYTWSFLDPSKNKFVTLESDAYAVQVEEGPGYNPATGNYAVNKEDVEMLARDIRYIKKDAPDYITADHHLFGSAGFYALLGIPFIAGAGAYLFTAKRKKREKDTVSMKNRRANPVAKKRLAKAASHLHAPDKKLFFDEVIKTIWGYLGDKLNMAQSDLTKENIHDHLMRKHVTEATAADTLQLLDTCELALFAPQLSTASPDIVYKKALDLIAQLENELK